MFYQCFRIICTSFYFLFNVAPTYGSVASFPWPFCTLFPPSYCPLLQRGFYNLLRAQATYGLHNTGLVLFLVCSKTVMSPFTGFHLIQAFAVCA